MNQWTGKAAVVTGASSGIGAATAKALCHHGVHVVGLARRVDRLEQLQAELVAEGAAGHFHAHKCDLTAEENIKAAFKWTIDKLGGVDILINNAGVHQDTCILDDDNEDMLQKVWQTNVTSVVSCTKKAYKSMKERNAPGFIINVSSVLGHAVFQLPGLPRPTLNLYPSTKFALKALIEVLRQELVFTKDTKIRISNISPGLVNTEMVGNAMDSAAISAPILQAEDVAASIIHMLAAPPHVHINDIVIKPSGEPY